MSILSDTYAVLSDLNLWMKVKSSDDITLADIPAIIKLRISYIIENWQLIRKKILDKRSSYSDPERLIFELDKFNDQVKVFITRPNSLTSINEDILLSKYYTVFDSMSISDLLISPQEETIIESEILRISSLTLNSFKQMRQSLIDGRDYIADNIGGGDATYNAIFNRSSLPKLLNKSTRQIIISAQIQTGIDAITDIIANSFNALQDTAIIDPFAFARANANNPNINIESFSSGRLARLNYGESLQTLASRTMGDQSKWVELAIANNLKPPYIDEVGEKIPLIANGKNNTINIAKTDAIGKANIEKLYINQIVILQSDDKRSAEQRIIISIKQVPISGEIVIELDGDSNLDMYKISDNATIRVFKPNTINSNFYILIPTDEPLPADIKQETPWFLRSKGQDEKNAGIDILINDNNDLSFTASGDLQLSYGIANGIQALKILLSTNEGSRPLHIDYGIVNLVGDTNADPDTIRKNIAESVSQQILNDSRFSRLDFMTVQSLENLSGYLVNVGVVLTGSNNSVIPISFKVNVSKS